VSAPQRPLELEFEPSMKLLSDINKSRRNVGKRSRNHGSAGWEQVVVPVSREQDAQLREDAKCVPSSSSHRCCCAQRVD
jgi:hypothetical protein